MFLAVGWFSWIVIMGSLLWSLFFSFELGGKVKNPPKYYPKKESRVTHKSPGNYSITLSPDMSQLDKDLLERMHGKEVSLEKAVIDLDGKREDNRHEEITQGLTNVDAENARYYEHQKLLVRSQFWLKIYQGFGVFLWLGNSLWLGYFYLSKRMEVVRLKENNRSWETEQAQERRGKIWKEEKA